MGLKLHYNRVIFVVVIVLLFTFGHSQDFIWSRATYYGSPECLGNPTGACGYGEFGRTLNDGYVAGVHRPYKNGTGCGGCYQVRCKARECSEDGVEVVATDWGVGDWTDFLLTARAYAKMARTGFEAKLLSYGVVDIDYRRIPCRYRGSTLIFNIHENSKYPHYLALIIIYPTAVYDVTAVHVWQEDCKAWRPMRKPFGAVWDMENPPRGVLSLRFQFSASASASASVNVEDNIWIEAPNIIPDYWKGAATYDTGIELH